MERLTRQQLIEQLRAAATGEIEIHTLSSWAFDQFYAEEEGTVEFEPGYRRAIGAVLDDLMFGDQPGFYLTTTELDQMIQHLSLAEPVADDVDDDEEDDADEDLE
ncbi:MAG TPA: hypothetical protein VFZ66_09205 [Herpetosiphonaceae bacterium]